MDLGSLSFSLIMLPLTRLHKKIVRNFRMERFTLGPMRLYFTSRKIQETNPVCVNVLLCCFSIKVATKSASSSIIDPWILRTTLIMLLQTQRNVLSRCHPIKKDVILCHVMSRDIQDFYQITFLHLHYGHILHAIMCH